MPAPMIKILIGNCFYDDRMNSAVIQSTFAPDEDIGEDDNGKNSALIPSPLHHSHPPTPLLIDDLKLLADALLVD